MGLIKIRNFAVKGYSWWNQNASKSIEKTSENIYLINDGHAENLMSIIAHYNNETNNIIQQVHILNAYFTKEL